MFKKIDRKFNLIVCNPPYVKNSDFLSLDNNIRSYEPKSALVSSDSGMSHLKKVIKGSKKRLYDNGVLVVEIGYNQSKEIMNFLKNKGLVILLYQKIFLELKGRYLQNGKIIIEQSKELNGEVKISGSKILLCQY